MSPQAENKNASQAVSVLSRLLENGPVVRVMDECPECEGAKEIPCRFCDGMDDDCGCCRGFGTVECPRCEGAGVVEDDEDA